MEQKTITQTGISANSVAVMRNHKDTVFRMLFRNKKELLSLYNALNGTDYKDEDALQVETLEHAIYMGVSDDVAFLLDCRLNIFEQQASYNPNMPLRDLVYIATHYAGFIKDESIYSSKLVKIPAPRFVVFYNGTRKQPERQVLKLSDAFAFQEEEPQLELKVLMLNINKGYNQELLAKCRTLQEYCVFVETIREYQKQYPVAEAVTMAVDECIRKDVLREFLTAQKAEVIQMSIFEFDVEEEIKKLRRSEFNYGKEVGLEAGILGIIQTCREFGASREQTLEQIMKTMSVEEKQAREYLAKFWEKENG